LACIVLPLVSVIISWALAIAAMHKKVSNIKHAFFIIIVYTVLQRYVIWISGNSVGLISVLLFLVPYYPRFFSKALYMSLVFDFQYEMVILHFT